MSTGEPIPSETKGFCRNCGTSLTAETLREVRGVLYCEACLSDLAAKPQPVEGAGNPALAAVLGVVPGLGAVYNGDYPRALIHFLVFVGLVTMASHGGPQPLTGLMIAGLFVYMPVDAYMCAKAKLLGQKPTSPLGDLGTDLPWGPILLIGFGALLLLDKFDLLDLDRIGEYFFPLALIAIGAILLRKRMRGRTSPSEAESHERRN